MSVLIAILSVIGGPAATLVSAQEIRVAGPNVHLGDVAVISGVAPSVRSQLADRVVARIPAGRATVALTRPALSQLIRRAAPSLSVRADSTDEQIIVRTAAQPSLRTCRVAIRPLRSGEAIRSQDTAASACAYQMPAAAIIFDRRAGLPRAAQDITTGTYLGAVLPAGDGVDRGAQLTLAARVGPVTIERTVIALQASTPGRRLFVRTGDGAVASLRLASDEAREAAR